MRILINGLAAAGARTGVGHYTAELVRCLQASCAPDEVVCYQSQWGHSLKRGWAWLRSWMEKKTPGPAGPPRPTWGNRLLGGLRSVGTSLYARQFRALSRQGFDLYHEPNYIPLDCDLPTVTTVLDLSVLLHPQWHPADRVADFERRFRDALERCAHVLTISDFGRDEVIRTLGLPPHRVSRTYMGARPHFRPLPSDEVAARVKALGLPARYLLHVGTIEPRKNLLTLLRAYCDLPAAVRDSCPLVLVGGWGWNSGDVYDFLQSSARHHGVIHAGYLAEADLPAVYNAARALVFPTHYEGFGMPPVEMMACGGAVIASTAGAVAEVVSGRGHLVEPNDTPGWRDALKRVIVDDDWHASLCHGGPELAARFTWERCAADTLAVYRALHRSHIRAA